MKQLKIYYTIPYFVPEKDQEKYSAYLDYANVAKDHDIPFEMISFQDSPGKFLTDKAVYRVITEIGDEAFPITVLNNKVIKTTDLPSQAEFSELFESLERMTYIDLIKEAKIIEDHVFPDLEELEKFSCRFNCSTCKLGSCGVVNFDDFNDLDF